MLALFKYLFELIESYSSAQLLVIVNQTMKDQPESFSLYDDINCDQVRPVFVVSGPFASILV